MERIDVERVQWRRVAPYLFEIPRVGGMRVPGRIYATDALMADIRKDRSPEQVANVACMPGIVGYSLAMPDIHWGYGFPIGGVAAFDLDDGVISPGGVGYDINCGVRLLRTRLARKDVEPHLKALADQIYREVPSGVGAHSKRLDLGRPELEKVMRQGAPWAVSHGYGTERDLRFIEEGGSIEGANPDAVSHEASARGSDQLGTLGSGNHFLEVGHVAEIYDPDAARAMGLREGQVTVIIHCGSRGFGHQVCTDYVGDFQKVVRKYGIDLPDRQLVCAPFKSPEGQAYLGAMRAAINWAFANRQIIVHWTREAFRKVLGLDDDALGMDTVYEVAHNIAKVEEHEVEGRRRTLCVHRKGATRAYAPGRREVPEEYRAFGQPVLIPGDMGRYSYVLAGTDAAMTDTFGSTCHGAGRMMSRTQAKKTARGRNIAKELEALGIVIRGASRDTVDEEISEAYKDVANVVDAVKEAGISRKVAQLRPLAVVKG